MLLVYKTRSLKYNSLMLNLPICQVLPQLKKELLSHKRLVLQAPPGAGKTTALPLSLLDEPWLDGKKIIMLEPRRLAVRSSAARMAEILGEKVGESVGYQIKMESVQSKKTRILIVTEGILTRKLQADPSLEEFALVIFDEFHERSIHADLSLALCLESQSLIREELRLLVMSATLNTLAVSALLEDAPIIKSEGRSYPIEDIYLDTKTSQPKKKELPVFINNLLKKLLKEEEGNILVFLPGVSEIKRLESLIKQSLSETNGDDIFVSVLYGNLSKEEQDRAIKAPEKGSRKIVISTNIAQTSLTIEGIRIVIDSGLQNSSVFNSSSGMNRLESSFISEDSATQRAGRAGRLSEGKAYHLWHKGKILLKHDKPEILSSDLTQMLLELALWGSDDITELQWMDQPGTHALSHAKELLVQLGAISEKGRILEHGKKMASIGLHPRLAHMMIKAQQMDLSYMASLLCVLISEKDIYKAGFRSSDMQERVCVLHDVNRGESINAGHIDLKQCRSLLKMAKRLENKFSDGIDEQMVGVLLAFAYPERISQIRADKSSSYLLSSSKGAFLHKEDELFAQEYLAVCDLDGNAQNSAIYKAASLSKEQIEEYLGEMIEERESLSWNAELQRVEARKRKILGSLVLKETQIQTSLDKEASLVLLEAVSGLGLDVLSVDKNFLGLRQRVNFVNRHKELLPDNTEFPDFGDKYLLETMQDWLLPFLEGKSSLKSCQSLNLYSVLSSMLSWEQMHSLDLLAPSKIKVASGSNIVIDYADVNRPVLAVRLQEMFGTEDTPCLLNGALSLTLHLLSPAHRPMQVTQDLKSFWETTYADVKKELRGKYKRHYWPDDPLSAQATSKTKKNM